MVVVGVGVGELVEDGVGAATTVEVAVLGAWAVALGVVVGVVVGVAVGVVGATSQACERSSATFSRAADRSLTVMLPRTCSAEYSGSWSRVTSCRS
jgi:hypothetical protein